MKLTSKLLTERSMDDLKITKPSSVRLTRACRECIRTKRKCSLSLPSCDRCKTKKIRCAYTNAPLGPQQDLDSNQHTPGLITSFQDNVFAGAIANDSIFQLPRIHNYVPEVQYVVPVDVETFAFMRRLARRHVINFGTQGGNTFVHKDVLRTQLSRNVQTICRHSTNIACRQSESEIRVQEQIEYILGSMALRLRTAPSVPEMLFLVQGVLLIQIITLFILSTNPFYRDRAEKRQFLLHMWTSKLWAMVPSQLPSSLSAREAFLLAESVRRTIIVSGEFQGLYHCSKYGWVQHNMFLDTLPFEKRAALWDMPEEEFGTYFVNDKQDIISWREFADMFDTGLLSDSFTPFEMMLLVAAKSKPVVEARLKARMAS